MKYRIFIESDILQQDELNSAKREAYDIAELNREEISENVFDETLDFAWHDLEKTWASVKKADEIYANSSLMPLVGNSYMGAPVIFNGMCERAVKENVTGKIVYILRRAKDIYWNMIDIKTMKKAFKNNSLFMYNDEYEIEKMNIKNIK